MKKVMAACITMAIFQFVFIGLVQAQLTSLPNGGNKRASVAEQIGITEVTINYSRPHVKNREGHIWGELIPVGYVDQGFGPSKAAPWRAGANENTTIEFSTNVKIEGQSLAAGKYGFFVAYDPNECTLLFSKNTSSWGSFYYNPAEDALRVKVKPIQTDKSVEWLKYEFADQTPTSATVQLQWEKLIIPFKIDVDVINTQLESYRNELRSSKGFTWESWNEAALYCAQNKTNLDEALLWADNATNVDFGGSQSFQAWSTKAMILDSLGRSAEATAAMKKGLPFGDVNELYFYARTLAANKKGKEAFEIFKMDYDKHPDVFLTNAGMARAYSAIGDYKKALPFAQKARAQAPDQPNKDRLDKIIKTLQDGKDVN
ncbi:Protein of unknown function (DUF2911) [Chitinophaga niastensis]|uniref:Uncharacterized protein n=1 Tax=Chitinophaga niastensis TaxID=536980 RepID=A0A2P8HVY4_CHINA|nr:DUF2911 domain-containing protein [Chitinophaga niastensis]PSL50334.1 Protein of unknown function (DUF2911) [Chitinophaga niastensis]